MMMKHEKKLSHLRDLSHTLDSKFEGPMGFRFGLDAIIGLIPVVGDFVTSGMSLYIIAMAASMGVGPTTLVRMSVNVLIENLFDMIPFLGNFFDFYWKSNNRNIKLIEKHLANPTRETIKSRMIVALIFFTLLAILIASGYVTFIVIEALVHWILSIKVD
jgi:hypothetical protein